MRFVGMVAGVCALVICALTLASIVVPPIFSIYANAFTDLFGMGGWNGQNAFLLRHYGLKPLGGLLVALVAAVVAILLLRPSAVRGIMGRNQADDVQLLQEIHRGLTDLDKRVEALETILLERSRVAGSTFEGVGR